MGSERPIAEVAAERISAALLIGRLMQRQERGAAALVLVDGYPEREAIAEALRDEAQLFDTEAQAYSDQRSVKLPSGPAQALAGLIVLVDAGRAADWAEWLESHREQFLDCARFVIVIVLATEASALLRQAPSFFSWVKGRGYRIQSAPPVISPDEVARSLRLMTDRTGLTPAQFVAAWERGELKDTFQNNYWSQLARLVGEPDEEPDAP